MQFFWLFSCIVGDRELRPKFLALSVAPSTAFPSWRTIRASLKLNMLRPSTSTSCSSATSRLGRARVGSTSPGRRVVVYDAYSGPGRYIDDVVARACDLPLFVFLDPYGFTLPFDKLVQVLKCRDKPGSNSPFYQPKTEVLINFSFEAVRRNAGALTSEVDYAARNGQVRSISTFLGDDGWQDLVRAGDEDWIRHVLRDYARRVKAATGYGCISASVADSLTAKPVYQLILFTRHRDGFWKMMDAMSHARKHWRQWLVDRGEEANAGQGEIRGLDWDDNEKAWVEEIARNIEGLLAQDRAFVLDPTSARCLAGRSVWLARRISSRRSTFYSTEG
jgi:hypothetical protein